MVKHHVARVNRPVALIRELLNTKITGGLPQLGRQEGTANVCADHLFVEEGIDISTGGFSASQLQKVSLGIEFAPRNHPIVVGSRHKDVFVPAGSMPPKLRGLHSMHAHLGRGGKKVLRAVDAPVCGNPRLSSPSGRLKNTKILLIHMHAQRASGISGLNAKCGSPIGGFP